uniref:Adenine nucleotide translocase lysine methyltransferase n=1 Tax=Balaenoptera musculus TaxID=9771 RepID=A0A8C0DV58_BALMU
MCSPRGPQRPGQARSNHLRRGPTKLSDAGYRQDAVRPEPARVAPDPRAPRSGTRGRVPGPGRSGTRRTSRSGSPGRFRCLAAAPLPARRRGSAMEQDDPAEALTELRERRLGALELLQVAAGSGLVAYAVWALLLQPGFRRVPLRLQVPYVGASARQVEHVLSLLRGRPGKMVDLGSGDGRIVLAAHKCGLRPAVGYELNPWLVGLAWLHAWRAGCVGNVSYRRENLWKVHQLLADLWMARMRDRHPSIYQGRGWNHECIEGLSLGTCGTARMVWRCRCCYCCPHTARFALPCGFAHSLGPYAERWTGRQTNWTDPCTPQPDGSGLRRPNPGPGYSGGLSQPGARRASRRRRRSAGRDWPDVRTAPFGHARAPSCARTRSLPRTRVLRAPCSGLRARRFQAGPAGGASAGAGS